MNRAKVLLTSLLIIGLAGTSAPIFGQSSEESAGRTVEQAGKLREALTNYTTALQTTSPGSDAEQRLLERAAAISSKVSPLPALPAEAERRFVRGQALVEGARDADAFMRAAAEFRTALRAAPWLADAHYNLGIVLDKAQRFSEAIRSLKLYILAAPNAKEAGEAQRLIYRIEVRQEEAQRAKAEAERAEVEKQKRRFENLAGRWVSRDSDSAYHYQITLTGTNSFSIKFISYDCRPTGGASGCSTLTNSHVVDATVSGDQISGRGSLQFNDNYRKCAWSRFEYPVGGKISEDGNTIRIMSYPDIDLKTCRGGPPSATDTLTRESN